MKNAPRRRPRPTALPPILQHREPPRPPVARRLMILPDSQTSWSYYQTPAAQSPSAHSAAGRLFHNLPEPGRPRPDSAAFREVPVHGRFNQAAVKRSPEDDRLGSPRTPRHQNEPRTKGTPAVSGRRSPTRTTKKAQPSFLSAFIRVHPRFNPIQCDQTAFGNPSRVNRPSTLILTPSISTKPPLRRSTTMSQCRPLWLVLPLSG